MKLFFLSSCLCVILMAALTRSSVLDKKPAVKETNDFKNGLARAPRECCCGLAECLAFPELPPCTTQQQCHIPCGNDSEGGKCVEAGICCHPNCKPDERCNEKQCPLGACGGNDGCCIPCENNEECTSDQCSDECADHHCRCRSGDCTCIECLDADEDCVGEPFDTCICEAEICKCECDPLKCLFENGKCTGSGTPCPPGTEKCECVGDDCKCGPCKSDLCPPPGTTDNKCGSTVCIGSIKCLCDGSGCNVCGPCDENECHSDCILQGGGECKDGKCVCNPPPPAPCTSGCNTTITFNINTCGSGSGSPCTTQTCTA